MYLNMDKFLRLLNNYGYPTFILTLVCTYIHEFLHEAIPNSNEQCIHDLECLLAEDYLGIRLPEAFKNLKASDFYEEKKGNISK